MSKYDLDKTGAPQALLMRRGDEGTEYIFSVVHSGEPFDLTGYTVALEATLHDGKVYQGDCEITDATQGQVRYVSDTSLTSAVGEVYPSYLALTQGNNRFTSTDLHIFILPNTDIDDGEYGEYKDRLAEINEEWEALKKQIEQGTTVEIADGSITVTKLAASAFVTIAEVDSIFGG